DDDDRPRHARPRAGVACGARDPDRGRAHRRGPEEGGLRAPFAVRLARREARSGARRIGVYTGAIALGVAALVAINSFRAGVVASVEAEAKSLLGADLRLSSSQAFPAPVRAALDSVAAAGVEVSEVTRLASMVRATR